MRKPKKKLKLKSKRGAAKRFKLTASGKIKRGQAFQRHGNVGGDVRRSLLHQRGRAGVDADALEEIALRHRPVHARWLLSRPCSRSPGRGRRR